MNKFILTALFILLSVFANLNRAYAATDYATLYEKAQVPDFELVFNIDPYQNEDYQKYAYAPYPLFRLSSTVYFKNQTVPAGYYILTPRVMKNRDYVFFKEAGKVKYIIPVVKKNLFLSTFIITICLHQNIQSGKVFVKTLEKNFIQCFEIPLKKPPRQNHML